MKLTYRIVLRLALVLLPMLALWAVFFYFAMIGEINDETDDALEDYSELLIIRTLAGRELPGSGSGSNNSYQIEPVSEEYAAGHSRIEYLDADIYIPEKEETEPARVLKTVFMDKDGNYFRLTVLTPTIEKEDLLGSILYWIVFLYLMLLLTILLINLWVIGRNMRPLYALLRWLEAYKLGNLNAPLGSSTKVSEFRKLNEAVARSAHRSEELFEQQKQFIGNASHEMQTPLAVLSNRIEWLMDNTELQEEQFMELSKMQRTIDQVVRLNKSLLLLSKIENGQFPDSTAVDVNALVGKQVESCREIFSSLGVELSVHESARVSVTMNESLATILVSNLLRNACIHTAKGGRVEVELSGRSVSIANTASGPALDGERIFERFYQGAKKEGSTGLGLAIAGAICKLYDIQIRYDFREGMHFFTLILS